MRLAIHPSIGLGFLLPDVMSRGLALHFSIWTGDGSIQILIHALCRDSNIVLLLIQMCMRNSKFVAFLQIISRSVEFLPRPAINWLDLADWLPLKSIGILALVSRHLLSQFGSVLIRHATSIHRDSIFLLALRPLS